MGERRPKSFWRTSRRIFRWTRITVWLMVLALLGALVYLNRVGLPDFLKRRLLDELRTRGVELHFSRMRLAWYRGVVAENVLFGGTNRAGGPEIYAETVELRPDVRALKKFKLDVGGLGLRRGRLTWLLNVTNHPPRTLVVESIEAEVRFLPEDEWQIDQFRASYAGANLQLSGTITNASALREWRAPQPERGAPPGQLDETMNELVGAFERVRFRAPPELNLKFSGDARDLQSFQGFVTLRAPGADSPWGSATNLTLNARLTSGAAPQHLPVATLNVKAGWAKTKWAATRDMDLALNFAGVPNQTNRFQASLDLRAGATSTDWCEAGRARGTFRWTQSLTNPFPTEAACEVWLTRVRTKWGTSESAHSVLHLWPAPPDATAHADEGWAWWGQIEPFQVACHLELKNVEARKLIAQEITCDLGWRPPELTVSNLAARLYGGRLDAQVALDVHTRAARVRAATDIELQSLHSVLPEPVGRQLQEFRWESPPKLAAEASAILPAWTNRAADWSAEVLPTLRVAGEVESGPMSFRSLQVNSLRSHFACSNSCLSVPDLHITRPEGEVSLSLVADSRTRNLYSRVRSSIDPLALRPLLDEKASKVFQLIRLTQPPSVEAEVWLAKGGPAPAGISGRIAVTNFSFRGEPIVTCKAALLFTNQVLEVYQPDLVRTDGVVRADLVRVDFKEDKVYLTNGFSTVDPMAIMRAIGTNTAKVTAPYHFLRPPNGLVNGVAPMHGSEGFDLHVALDGGPFRWSLFNLSHVSGVVRYVGAKVKLQGIEAEGYSGHVGGSAEVTLTAEPGDEIQFGLNVTNADLHQLMRDVTDRTNRLEGTFSGRLTVTSANTANRDSWQGYGEVALRDGWVWELPLFGVLSPVLNGIVPGLGQSRFTRGGGTFTITNSVIHSSDLELSAPLLRLKCHGTADFRERVNIRVEADPLRNTWLIGPILSSVFWPVSKALEYKVTGTLGAPKAEPLYAPAKLLLFPLQPITTLKDIFSNPSAKTNAPPK